MSFPSHPTLSLSLPLALLGLSPLILSSFSTLPAFTVPGHDIDAVKFLTFLGCFSMGVNLFASMFMRVTLPVVRDHFDDDSDSDFDPYESAIADLSASYTSTNAHRCSSAVPRLRGRTSRPSSRART